MIVNLVSNITPRSKDSFLKERIMELKEFEQRSFINRLLYLMKKHFDKFGGNTNFPLLLGHFEEVHYRK